jgi:hypothetical protein
MISRQKDDAVTERLRAERRARAQLKVSAPDGHPAPTPTEDTMTDTTTTRTITLTGRAPVTIVEAEWPLIATAKWYAGEFEAQANRTATIRVREHRDGRRIVYGVTTTHYVTERSKRAGVLVPAPAGLTPEQLERGHVDNLGDTAATITAIALVAEAIGYPDLAQECVADLPAEAI